MGLCCCCWDTLIASGSRTEGGYAGSQREKRRGGRWCTKVGEERKKGREKGKGNEEKSKAKGGRGESREGDKRESRRDEGKERKSSVWVEG